MNNLKGSMEMEAKTTVCQVEEQWRAIDGFPGYEVSNLGRVRSWRIERRKAWAQAPRLRATPLNADGYPRLTLIDEHGQPRKRFVHVLVMAAFLRPKEATEEVNHLDAIKTNNRLDNLEYTSRQGNMQHAARLDLMSHRLGIQHPKCKLSYEQVELIRQERIAGGKLRDIAARYSITPTYVSMLARGYRAFN